MITAFDLLSKRLEYYEEAVCASDKALAEFTSKDALIRQWCYRSMLMVEAGKPDEALNCIYQIASLIQSAVDPFKTIISHAYNQESRSPERKKKIEQQWRNSIKLLDHRKTPESIKTWFGINHPDPALQAKISYK